MADKEQLGQQESSGREDPMRAIIARLDRTELAIEHITDLITDLQAELGKLKQNADGIRSALDIHKNRGVHSAP